MSGLKVQMNNRHALIEACHIKPFAQDHDDTIGNGIDYLNALGEPNEFYIDKSAVREGNFVRAVVRPT